MKKIFSSIILSALVIGMFLKPVSVYAYTDLNTYIDPDLSIDDAKEYVAQTILAYALAAGAEMVVPGSGSTVAQITDKVWDVIDFTDELYSWALNAKRNMQNGYLPWADVTYNLDPGSASYNAPIMLAWDHLKDNWNNDSEQIETYPDINYLPYLELINGKNFNYSYNLTDNWFSTITSNDITGNVIFTGDTSSVSYLVGVSNTYNQPYNWNKSNQVTNYVASYVNGSQYILNRSYTLNPFSVYINNIGNSYQVTTSEFVPISIISFNNTPFYRVQTNNYTNGKYQLGGYDSNPTIPPYFSYAGSLEECLQFIAMNCRNVNLYVDGIPWSIITQPPDPIQLGGNTYITDTNTPVYYDFPDGTLFDPNAFAAIMRQLIDLNNTGNAITIQLDDVLESFTDEYGVTAQYVVNIVRNDYDNLLSEQYGNRQVRVQFPEELKQYSEEITYVMNNFGDDLIPQDLLTIICCGGILLLIGFLINRMLE